MLVTYWQICQGWERKMRENREVKARRAEVRGPKGQERGMKVLGGGS